MPVVSVRIPQLGEGLQEALLVEFLKQPGDSIKRDEPIYVMETDKATSEVESPYEGVLVDWVVKEGQVLQIGTQIANMEVAEGVKEMPAGHEPPTARTSRPDVAQPHVAETGMVDSTNGDSSAHSVSSAPVPGDIALPAAVATVSTESPTSVDERFARPGVAIPPRTRKYLRQKGIAHLAAQMPTSGSKLMPADVDRFLASQSTTTAIVSQTSSPTAADPVSTEDYDEVELARAQQTLNYRLTRGSQLCVPVTVMTEINWTAIDEARALAKKENGPSAFTMLLWCVTRALARHPKFRSTLSSDGRILRTYHNAKLGIAVARPGDELVTAVVERADQMPPEEFYRRVVEQVELAREGADQADAATTISVSNIGTAGMKIGIPAIVAPAVATLAVGQTFEQAVPDPSGFRFQKTAMLSLTFDHRVINGIGSAEFLNDVKRYAESFVY